MDTMLILLVSISLVLLISFIVVEYTLVQHGVTVVPAPQIPRETEIFGTSGPPLAYVVIGDSTAIGQGCEYHDSIAFQTASYLSGRYQVKLTNIAISGATAESVATLQLEKALACKPDLVLLAVGANDAVRMTSTKTFIHNLHQIISSLLSTQPTTKLVLTGSPELRSVPRFPWPLKQLMAYRTKHINRLVHAVIADSAIQFAPVALKTGSQFLGHPELFAADKFHPNAAGYATWIPVLTTALDAALAAQSSSTSSEAVVKTGSGA